MYIGTRIMYWYHPDYVSNVDMITDKSGEAYELFLYNAWGESLYHWSSSSTNSWSSPYRLNSKELDSETGMHYYGARYHHPKLSVWMSVDPLAHQTLEAYQFTGNNPIYYIDPDGRTEYPSYAAYKKALGNKALSRQDMWKQGHWLYSDRMYHPNSWSGAVTRRSSTFNKAAALNTANVRSGDYTNLGQRKAYYGWAEEFYQDNGYGVKWFTAAKNVVGSLEDALDYGGIGRVITGGSYGTNDRINSFIKAGNKVILDDVMGRIADLASGGYSNRSGSKSLGCSNIIK